MLFPSNSISGLNWLYLVEMSTVVVAAIFYLFYLNRIFGFCFASVLNLFLWRKTDSYFECQSLQVSPLGGRILFKDLRYYSRNQNLRILTGTVTLRYWFWHVRTAEDLQHDVHDRPCRLKVIFTGVEWFLYNRTPAYDAFLEHFGYLAPSETKESRQTVKVKPLLAEQSNGWLSSFDWLFEMLPIDVGLSKGSIALGNVCNRFLLINGFDECLGTYGAVKARSECDRYKQIFQFKFKNVKSVFRTNIDYEREMHEYGQHLKEAIETNQCVALPRVVSKSHPTRSTFQQKYPSPRWADVGTLRGFRELIRAVYGNKLSLLLDSLHIRRRIEPWRGLARYKVTEKAGHHNALHDQDYAKVATLLETPTMELVYYADTVGQVPQHPAAPHQPSSRLDETLIDVGNLGLPPEWGVEVGIAGGFINYGPWADRQRASLQRLFTPSTYFDETATPRRVPGDLRLHTDLKIFVMLNAETIVRVPTREGSKDWRYVPFANGEAQRPYGWLNVSLGANTSFSMVVPVVASEAGNTTNISVDARNVAVTTSVNNSECLKVQKLQLNGNMHNPLCWQELRKWFFTIDMSKAEIWHLRDHATLITDLIKDFMNGDADSTPDIHFRAQHFVPFVYQFDYNLDDFALHLYLNEGNIIRNPAEKVDNTLFTISGPSLRSSVKVPILSFKAPTSQVTFSVEADNLTTDMSYPLWDTHASFLANNRFGLIRNLDLQGSYLSHESPSPDNVEVLSLSVGLTRVEFVAFGHIVKHLIDLREFYFGHTTHFVTLEEYRAKRTNGDLGDPVEAQWAARTKSGEPPPDNFEVRLDLEIFDGIVMLPQALYSDSSVVVLQVPEIQLHLRNNSLFMDFGVNIDPFNVFAVDDRIQFLVHGPPENCDSMSISGLDISAHRLFGAPPRATVYLCIWEFALGTISGRLPLSSIQALSNASSSFSFGLKDAENALPPAHPGAGQSWDVTLLSLNVDRIDVAIPLDDTCLVKVMVPEGISVFQDDIPREPYLKQTVLDIPRLAIHMFALCSAADPIQPNSQDEWFEIAAFSSDLLLDSRQTSKQYHSVRDRQQNFVMQEDAATRRFVSFYEGGRAGETHHQGIYCPWPVTQGRGSSSIYTQSDATVSSASFPTDPSNDATGFLGSTAEGSTSLGRNRQSDASQHSVSSEDSSSSFASQESDTSSVDGRFQWSTMPARSAIPAIPELQKRWGPYAEVLRLVRLGDEASVPVRTRPIALPPSQFNSSFAFEAAFNDANAWDEDERTVIHVSSRTPIYLLVTPLLLDHTAAVISSLPPPLAEHVVDAIALKYANSYKPNPQSTANRILLQFSTSRIDIDCVQQADLQAKSVNITEGRSSDFQLQIQAPKCGLDIFSSSVGADPVLAVTPGWHRISLRLRFPSPPISDLGSNLSLPNHPPEDAVIAEAEASTLRFVRHFQANKGRNALLDVDLGKILIDFTETAPEFLTCSVFTWYRAVLGLQLSHGQFTARRQNFCQHLISESLRIPLEEGPLSDPAFLSHGYILVHAGLRLDDGWRLLSHFQHCYQMVKDRIVPLPSTSRRPARLSPPQMFRSVEKALRAWRPWEAGDGIRRRREAMDPLAECFGMPTEWAKQHRYISLKANGRFDQIRSTLTDKTSSNHLVLGRSALNFSISFSGTGAADRILLEIDSCGITVQIDPGVQDLVHHISQVRYYYEEKFRAVLNRGRLLDRLEPKTLVLPTCGVQVLFHLERFQVGASELAIGAEVMLEDVSLSACVSHRKPDEEVPKFNVFLECGRITILASEIGIQERFTIASVQVHTLRTFACYQPPKANSRSTRSNVRLLCDIDQLQFELPRSLIRLQTFFDTWSEHNYPSSRFAFEDIKKDLELSQARRPSAVSEPDRTRIVLNTLRKSSMQMHMNIHQSSLVVQVAEFLKISHLWGRTTIFVVNHTALARLIFGLEIEHQSFNLGSAMTNKTRKPEQQLQIPTLRIQGHRVGSVLELQASLESIIANITPQLVDRLGAFLLKFSQDINETLDLINRMRHQQQPSRRTVPTVSLRWNGQFLLRHLRISVHSPTTVQHIEARQITGMLKPPNVLTQTHLWGVSVAELTLWLAPQTPSDTPASTTPSQEHLAILRVDVDVSNDGSSAESRLTDCLDSSSIETDTHVHIHVPRMRAALQPAAINALADFVDFYLHELTSQKRKRAAEINHVQQQLRQTFHATSLPGSSIQSPSFLERAVLSFRGNNINFAIPLTLEGTDSRTKMSFVISMNSVAFAARRASAGQASVTNLGFHFVNGFEWLERGDLMPVDPESCNRVVFPDVRGLMVPKKAQYTSDNKLQRVYHVEATSEGMDIVLDPMVVGHFFHLVQVFKISRERFERFSKEFRSSPADVTPTTPMPTTASTQPSQLLVEGSFTFHQGHIVLQHKMASSGSSHEGKAAGFQRKHKRGVSSISRPHTAGSHSEVATEEFVFPTVSLTLAYQKETKQLSHPTLRIGVVISQSSNILEPSLLPFVRDLLKDAQRAISARDAARTTPIPVQPDNQDNMHFYIPSASLRLSIGLRIDASRLTVSCAPASPIQAVLRWQGGGALLTTEPDARGFKLAVRSQAVSFTLGHPLAEQMMCLSGTASGLVGSISFDLLEQEPNTKINVVNWHALSSVFRVSLLEGHFDLRQVLDWIAFERTWLKTDIIPPSALQATANVRRSFGRTLTSAPATGHSEAPENAAVSKLRLYVMVQVDRTAFSCDLGHSLGKPSLVVTTLTSSLRSIPAESRSLDVTFASGLFNLGATSKLTGYVALSETVLRTVIRDAVPIANETRQNAISLRLDVGHLSSALDADHRRLLLLKNDPFHVAIIDDWSLATSAASSLASPTLNVSFTVRLGEFAAALHSDTLPIFFQVVAEFKAVITDARTRAFSGSTPSSARQTSDRFHLEGSQHPSLPAHLRDIPILRKMHIEIKRMKIVAFVHNFSNPEAWMFRSDTFKTVLSVGGSEDCIHRNTEVNVEPVHIYRLYLKRITPAEETTLALEQWLDAFSAASQVPLTRFPAVVGQQESWEESGRLEHRSTITFSGEVDLSRVLSFRDLRNDIMLFDESIQKARSKIRSPPEDDGKEEEETSTGAVDQAAVVMKRLEFVPLSVTVREPRVRGLGEASKTIVNYLRFDQETSPRRMHTGVVEPLDAVLKVLSDSYLRNLRSAMK